MDSEKRLTKINEGKYICGVCSGIGKYFNIDPTVIRIGFAALSIFGGGGLLAYIAAAIIMPSDPSLYRASGPQTPGYAPQEDPQEAPEASADDENS